jgi:opacity protein-like surface antigen
MKYSLLTAATGIALLASPALAAPVQSSSFSDNAYALSGASLDAMTAFNMSQVAENRRGRYNDYDYGRSGYDDRYDNRRDYRRGDYYREDRYERRYDRRQTRRTWRGNDGRYYCERDDGTTGLLIGGAAGAVIGSEVARRGDKTVGAILGGLGGALLGRAIDKSNSRCR